MVRVNGPLAKSKVPQYNEKPLYLEAKNERVLAQSSGPQGPHGPNTFDSALLSRLKKHMMFCKHKYTIKNVPEWFSQHQ